MFSPATSRSSPTFPLVAAAAVVGAMTSPFLAVYTVLLGIPAALLASLVGRRRPDGPARLVAAVAVGLVVGASLYFALAVAVTVVGWT